MRAIRKPLDNGCRVSILLSQSEFQWLTERGNQLGIANYKLAEQYLRQRIILEIKNEARTQ